MDVKKVIKIIDDMECNKRHHALAHDCKNYREDCSDWISREELKLKLMKECEDGN